MSAFEKIKRGLEQARSFARGDCEHEWVVAHVRQFTLCKDCLKCGVRITEALKTSTRT